MNRPSPFLLAYQFQRFGYFLGALFTRRGLFSGAGRAFLRGKLRRALLGFFPRYALALKVRHGLNGFCHSCGASCNLMFRCPQWDDVGRKCSIYEHRPQACRLFPITPADLAERDLVLPRKPCGYSFGGVRQKRVS